MKKRVLSCVIPFGCVIIAVSLIAAYMTWILSGTTETKAVTITRNLVRIGWYWTQYNLPPEGQLMVLTTKAEFEDYKALKEDMGLRANIHGKVFYGRFCCGETIPGKYVFLPTSELDKDVKQLVFFAADGSVWVIPNPPALLTPKDGELTVQATIYR